MAILLMHNLNKEALLETAKRFLSVYKAGTILAKAIGLQIRNSRTEFQTLISFGTCLLPPTGDASLDRIVRNALMGIIRRFGHGLGSAPSSVIRSRILARYHTIKGLIETVASHNAEMARRLNFCLAKVLTDPKWISFLTPAIFDNDGGCVILMKEVQLLVGVQDSVWKIVRPGLITWAENRIAGTSAESLTAQIGNLTTLEPHVDCPEKMQTIS
jgi:hypothetical protein